MKKQRGFCLKKLEFQLGTLALAAGAGYIPYSIFRDPAPGRGFTRRLSFILQIQPLAFRMCGPPVLAEMPAHPNSMSKKMRKIPYGEFKNTKMHFRKNLPPPTWACFFSAPLAIFCGALPACNNFLN
jgi:hypothetical protein